MPDFREQFMKESLAYFEEQGFVYEDGEWIYKEETQDEVDSEIIDLCEPTPVSDEKLLDSVYEDFIKMKEREQWNDRQTYFKLYGPKLYAAKYGPKEQTDRDAHGSD